MKATKWMVALVACSLTAAAGVGATATYHPAHIVFSTHEVGFTTPAWHDYRTPSLSFQKFTGPGTLTGIRAAITVCCATPKFEGTIAEDVIAGFNANIDVRVTVSPPGAPQPLECNHWFNGGGAFNPPPFTQTVVWSQGCGVPVDVSIPSTAWAQYIGTGTVQIPLDIDFVQEAVISQSTMQCHFECDVTITVELTYSSIIPGDMNCDGDVNSQDIDPFVLALFDAVGYASQYPDCDILSGDFSGDGAVNSQDIDGFIAALFGS